MELIPGEKVGRIQIVANSVTLHSLECHSYSVMKHILTKHISSGRENLLPAFTCHRGLCMALKVQKDFDRGTKEFHEANALWIWPGQGSEKC